MVIYSRCIKNYKKFLQLIIPYKHLSTDGRRCTLIHPVLLSVYSALEMFSSGEAYFRILPGPLFPLLLLSSEGQFHCLPRGSGLLSPTAPFSFWVKHLSVNRESTVPKQINVSHCPDVHDLTISCPAGPLGNLSFVYFSPCQRFVASEFQIC